MEEWKAQLYNISEGELDTVVWRYLTFPKFIGMISYGALWFSRLCFLIDEFEGSMPKKSVLAMKEKNKPWKSTFPDPEHQRQIDEWPETNVQDGRSLSVVNCWFIRNKESARMWKEYVGSSEGVVIKSTIREVRDSVHVPSEVSFIGKVNYVDFDTHEMSTYKASQAHERAFLKDIKRFKHESEMRIETMNLRTTCCLDPLGKPLSQEEVKGKGMNNFDERGLYIRTNIKILFNTIITAPSAPEWFVNLIRHIQLKSGFEWEVQRSQL